MKKVFHFTENFDPGTMMDAYLLKEESDNRDDTDSDQHGEKKEQAEDGVYCKYCQHQITSAKYSVEVSGGHHHTFFNPAGIIYEIRCFSLADGCLQQGPPSSEFTWFAGYTWRLVLCSVCLAHMGWFFNSGDSGFYGLIARNLSS